MIRGRGAEKGHVSRGGAGGAGFQTLMGKLRFSPCVFISRLVFLFPVRQRVCAQTNTLQNIFMAT